MQMLAANKPIHALNLSNNKLRDTFALSLIANLKYNRRLRKVILTGNVIDLKHIREIEKVLVLNRALARKNVLPVYQRQVEKLQLDPAAFNETLKKITEINYACQGEKALVKHNSDALKKTQQKEGFISGKVKDRKKTMDEELVEAEKKVCAAETFNQNEKKEQEKGIALMHKKITETKWGVEKLCTESM